MHFGRCRPIQQEPFCLAESLWPIIRLCGGVEWWVVTAVCFPLAWYGSILALWGPSLSRWMHLSPSFFHSVVPSLFPSSWMEFQVAKSRWGHLVSFPLFHPLFTLTSWFSIYQGKHQTPNPTLITLTMTAILHIHINPPPSKQFHPAHTTRFLAFPISLCLFFILSLSLCFSVSLSIFRPMAAPARKCHSVPGGSS